MKRIRIKDIQKGNKISNEIKLFCVAGAMMVLLGAAEMAYDKDIKTKEDKDNNAKELVSIGTYYHNNEDKGLLIEDFEEDRLIEKDIEDVDGSYIAKYLIANNISYCKMDDQYYTLFGGPLTISFYEKDVTEKFCSKDEFSQHGMVPAEYKVIGDDIYVDAKLMEYVVTLPDGKIISNDVIDDSYTLMESNTYTSKPYYEMENYNLKQEYNEDNNISYNLKRK